MAKEHFIYFFPFLRNEFRKLTKKDLNNEKTFKELFPNEKFDNTKLKAIYHFQNIKK